MRIVVTTSADQAVDYLNQVVVPAVAEGFREGHHDAEHHWKVEDEDEDEDEATPDADQAADEATAEVLGVRAHVTASGGSDGAVVVFVDTDFAPDGSDGPGLRVRVNDDIVYAGVAWEPADEEPEE